MKLSLWLGVGAAGLLACTAGPVAAGPIVLSGSNEVPPLNSQSSGIADIGIIQSKCPPATTSSTECYNVIGTVSTGGFTPTAAHIHRAKAGENGPVVVPLAMRPGSTAIFDVPSGTTVSRDVYEAWWNGQLYVNVHSTANPGGEVRGQLTR